MFKDTPKGLLEAVLAIHKESREKFIQEQQTRMSGREGPADPPAHKDAKKMVKWPAHLSTSGSSSSVQPRGGAGVKKGRAYGGAMQKEAAEGSTPRNEKEKKLAAMTPPRDKITHGDVLHGRGVRKEEAEQITKGLMRAIVKTTKEEVDLSEAKRLIHQEPGKTFSAKVYRDPEYNEFQVHFFKDGKHMGEGPVSYHDDKADAIGSAKTALKQMHAKHTQKEEKDTPGNGYAHQCAIHVKSEQYGQGRTLTSQHAEPDAHGNIAWYDVMFNEGIKRVRTEDIEILVSESHMNHKKKRKSM